MHFELVPLPSTVAWRSVAIAAVLAFAVPGLARAAPRQDQWRSPEPQRELHIKLAQSIAPKSDTLGSADTVFGKDDRKASAHSGGPDADQSMAAGAEATPKPGLYDGTWVVTTASANCRRSTWSFPLRVAGSAVKSGKNSGRVSPAGAVGWVSPALLDGAPIEWKGTLSGNSGSGTFGRRDGRCRGTFTATRG